MSFTDYPTCVDALSTAGLLKGTANELKVNTEVLDEAIKALIPVIENDSVNEFTNVALSIDQIVAALFPNFYPSTEVAPAERDDPELLSEVLEKDAARREMEKLVTTATSVASTGRVQKLFGQEDPPLLLVDVTVDRYLQLPDGSRSATSRKIKVRFATSNTDVIDARFVQGRGTRVYGIAKAMSDDVALAISRFPESKDKFMDTFGLQIDTAIKALTPNAHSRYIKELTGSDSEPITPPPPAGKVKNNEKVNA